MGEDVGTMGLGGGGSDEDVKDVVVKSVERGFEGSREETS